MARSAGYPDGKDFVFTDHIGLVGPQGTELSPMPFEPERSGHGQAAAPVTYITADGAGDIWVLGNVYNAAYSTKAIVEFTAAQLRG